MMYDMSDEPPEPGSLLESVFLLISKRRLELDFLRTKVMVRATLAPVVGGKGLEDAVEAYAKALFPFLEDQRKQEARRNKELLERVAKMGPLRIRPITNPDHRKLASRLRRSEERTKMAEESRRRQRVRRM
jgi:hypothetical protein